MKKLLAVAFAVTAFAQNALVPPPNLPYGVAITSDVAKKAAAAAIAEAAKNKWSMAVAIVDGGGYLVYFERMPDTQLGSVEIAMEKAKTAALFRRPTKSFQDALATGGENLRLLRLTGAIPVDGGFPLVVDGKIVGAIGASGGSSDQDGRTAQAGAAVVK